MPTNNPNASDLGSASTASKFPVSRRRLSTALRRNVEALTKDLRAQQMAACAEMERIEARSHQLCDEILAIEGCLILVREVLMLGDGG